MELRSALINERYLNGLLAQVEDYDVKEYFVYRFPHEPTESIQAVIARLDMLLFEDTARVAGRARGVLRRAAHARVGLGDVTYVKPLLDLCCEAAE